MTKRQQVYAKFNDFVREFNATSGALAKIEVRDRHMKELLKLAISLIPEEEGDKQPDRKAA